MKGAFVKKEFYGRNNQGSDSCHPLIAACCINQDEIIDLEGKATTSPLLII
jgi:hypothetical protein